MSRLRQIYDIGILILALGITFAVVGAYCAVTAQEAQPQLEAESDTLRPYFSIVLQPAIVCPGLGQYAMFDWFDSHGDHQVAQMIIYESKCTRVEPGEVVQVQQSRYAEVLHVEVAPNMWGYARKANFKPEE